MRATTELRSSLAPALVLTAAALFFGGGASDDSIMWLGAAAVVTVLVLAATQPLPARMWTLAPLAGLAAWCALSVAWSVGPDLSWSFANRTFVYLAFALLGAFCAARIRGLMLGLSAILGAVFVWSLAGKALPWLYEDYERVERLRAPVGYWNALALLGAVAIPLALCTATRWRWQGTLLAYGAIVTIGLTYSRGGVLVAVAVAVAWAVLSRSWIESVVTLVAAGIPAAVVLAVGFALPGVTSSGQPQSVRVQDGIVFGLVLAVAAAAAALLARVPVPEPTRSVRRAALSLVATAAAALVLVTAFNASAWWDSFTGPVTAELPNSPERLVETGSNYRWGWWTQAWHGWEEHRIAGSGAGTFAFTNLRHRTTSLDQAVEPHSLPLQFLTETGVIGFGLFVAAALTLVVTARRRPGPQLALALALPAFLLHGLVDIGWSFAAVAAPVFVAAGALSARPGERRLSPPAMLAAGGLALALAVSLTTVWLSDRWTAQAFESIDRPARAVGLAERARSIDPLSVEPLFAQALAEQSRRRYGVAHGLLQKATRMQPENKETWYALGTFTFRVLNCPRAALPALDRFTALDPQNPGNREYDRALAVVNSGRPNC